MLDKILLIIILVIIGYIIINKINRISNSKENFGEERPFVQRKATPSTQITIPLNKVTNKILTDQTIERQNDRSKDSYRQYDKILVDQQKDLTYYNNDVINQDKIYEDAYNIVNQIDQIDYGKVTTGMDKCKLSCNGVCFELGYTGSASCYPKTKPFDLGTLYKNPMFTYGIDGNKYNSINIKKK